MYQSLRRLGVPTVLVVYPGEFHEFTRPTFIKDRYERDLFLVRALCEGGGAGDSSGGEGGGLDFCAADAGVPRAAGARTAHEACAIRAT